MGCHPEFNMGRRFFPVTPVQSVLRCGMTWHDTWFTCLLAVLAHTITIAGKRSCMPNLCGGGGGGGGGSGKCSA